MTTIAFIGLGNMGGPMAESRQGQAIPCLGADLVPECARRGAGDRRQDRRQRRGGGLRPPTWW